ncbi:YceI family protein [Streptomyces sp. TR06-5]|uniref:YceI family protein n=1 Tax=unclassified Streptomyces TaxID=2593676 RepID=UPI00399FE0E3
MNAHGGSTTKRPRLGRCAIDTERSRIGFAGRHLFGLLPVRGTFALRSGTVDVAEPLQDSCIEVEIDAGSFRTGNPRRDRDVRSAKFLDTDRHPVFRFSSERVDEAGVSGGLTVLGVSRPVRLEIREYTVSGPDGFTVRATTRLDRTEFGVTAAPGLAGRHLDVTAEVFCTYR